MLRQIKYAPKSASGFNYASGSWVVEDERNGNATALASPGFIRHLADDRFLQGLCVYRFCKKFAGRRKGGCTSGYKTDH